MASKADIANKRLDTTVRDFFSPVFTGSWVNLGTEVDSDGNEVSLVERYYNDFVWLNKNMAKLRKLMDEQIDQQKSLGNETVIKLDRLRKARNKAASTPVELAEFLAD